MNGRNVKNVNKTMKTSTANAEKYTYNSGTVDYSEVLVGLWRKCNPRSSPNVRRLMLIWICNPIQHFCVGKTIFMHYLKHDFIAFHRLLWAWKTLMTFFLSPVNDQDISYHFLPLFNPSCCWSMCRLSSQGVLTSNRGQGWKLGGSSVDYTWPPVQD